jgi:tyrosine-protein phosphatase SIW14
VNRPRLTGFTHWLRRLPAFTVTHSALPPSHEFTASKITGNRMSTLQLFRSVAVFAVAVSLTASPTKVEAPGLPNFHQVNDHVFRGGQPLPQGWLTLANMGIKTVIDLRRTDEHSTEEEAKAVQAANMKYFNFPMKGVVAPSDEQVAKILALLNSNEPVFIHCKRGADRTGAVIACYRIEHDRWDRQQALNEAKSFGMAWTQVGLKKYVLSFQPKTAQASPAASPSM